MGTDRTLGKKVAVRSHHGQAGVNRLLARLAIEYEADGWTTASLCREAGVHRSVLDRWFDGRVSHPLLNPFVAFVEAMGKRVDIVSPHHQSLLLLDEFEVQALTAAAAGDGWRGNRWRETERGQQMESHLLSALRKLGKFTEGVSDAA